MTGIFNLCPGKLINAMLGQANGKKTLGFT
jgi:hypothetical protein